MRKCVSISGVLINFGFVLLLVGIVFLAGYLYSRYELDQFQRGMAVPFDVALPLMDRIAWLDFYSNWLIRLGLVLCIVCFAAKKLAQRSLKNKTILS